MKELCYTCKHRVLLGIKGCKHPKIREQHYFKKNPCPYWEADPNRGAAKDEEKKKNS